MKTLEDIEKLFERANYQRDGWTSIPLDDLNKIKEILKAIKKEAQEALLTELKGTLVEMKDSSLRLNTYKEGYEGGIACGHNAQVRATLNWIEAKLKMI